MKYASALLFVLLTLSIDAQSLVYLEECSYEDDSEAMHNCTVEKLESYFYEELDRKKESFGSFVPEEIVFTISAKVDLEQKAILKIEDVETYPNLYKSSLNRMLKEFNLLNQYTIAKGLPSKDGQIFKLSVSNPKYLPLGSSKSDSIYASDAVFVMVDVRPVMKSCAQIKDSKKLEKCSEKALVEFIYTNIEYPLKAKQNNTSGTVLVKFIIEKDGSFSDIKFSRDIGDGCGLAAVEVVKLMGEKDLWLPGRMQNNPVRVLYTLPIRFKL